MKYIFAIAILLCQFRSHAHPGLPAVRNAFYSVSEQGAASRLLLETIHASHGESPSVLLAYEGMYHMLTARELFNPFSKWSSFRKGRTMLDDAIEADAANPEIRLLRLSAQLNAPSFLGYNNNIEADKRVILNALDKLADTDLRRRIIEFMTDQGLMEENS